MDPGPGADVHRRRGAAREYGSARGERSGSDANGRFVFTNLEAASYRVTAGTETHAFQEYGAPLPGRAGEGRGTELSLKPGESLTSLVIRLIQPATLSGHVRSIRRIAREEEFDL